MENSIYVALSRQMSLQRQLDVTSNNIANMNTTGYKNQRMLFTEFLEKPGLHEKVSFVQDRAVVRDLSVGAMTQTGNPMDLALTGHGYFTVDTASGPRYTRAGNFKLNDQRQMVDGGGLPVLADNGQPITIPAGTSDVKVSGDGTVSTELGPVGKLNVVTFKNEQLMTEVGSGLYVSDEQPQPAPADTKVAQGLLEGSNVKPVVEMTQMIEVQRSYMSAQKVIENEHERIRSMIQKLGRSA
ncbi:flagellar basal-body rod protein FlgF [Azospirillum doebereinerae]|uniref:Flagellar basal-body rod protein FlgF n=1 Tax=Azospirillum doebereinerae TaxID=92933 RepID=A0A3S1CE38_9PROT|nr:flagellar basal-body rod protein FlgF [Azospirillum doebereinerae]MCG5243702.1 flagellar basal-body rod protein FlgF [Azospirillum doebereinerae]RUQ65217.1 flagellar basal-body rod protein FlgF [Azospirillum doebereinerae]